ncbi:hypothetical protein CCMSSC00406_0006574 [Pleurotus cornucopiae]|uniref:Uncharacterized protein n=1 Tax=Pleurotus cornucopiae TaxID=5321 RepID=A0ACB7IVI9_PLECO|nr:hypothetical protein CCMSSC00406_0006574 [Pleurotus cornucopiae]
MPLMADSFLPQRKPSASFLTNFALMRLSPARAPSPILSLPFDIFLDQIFLYLHVEDIMCLRRVNKMFFLLTHEPIIWKRFLQAMTLPLPPLRPYYRYSLRSNDFEIEQMVTRAISLDDNWRNHHTVARRHKVILTDKFIVEMKLLPGGKYLVVSETDEEGYRYSISVWLLDDAHGPRVLARTDMDLKVFNLQAKYTKYQGQNGIVISFVRRKFSRKTFPWLNPSQFAPNAEIDSPVPFDYEIACFCITLDQLEAMSDADIVPGSQKYYDRLNVLDPPFRTLAFMGSSQRMEHVSLFELNEEPYIIFVQQPNRIVLKNLSTGVRSTLQCNPAHDHPDKEHSISAIKALPGQKDIFVIRTIRMAFSAPPLVLIQLFDMPIAGEKFRNNPREEAAIDDKYLSDFVISDCNTPSLGPDHPKLRTMSGPPPPISVFARAADPNGVMHFKMWPKHIQVPPFAGRPPRTTYRYAIRLFQNQSLQLTGSNKAHVLPGTDRAIIYHVPEDDRSDTPPLVNLRKYIDPGYPHPDLPAPDPDEDVGVLRTTRRRVPHRVFSTLKMPSIWSKALGKGLAAIAWDEGIGRVCMSGHHDRLIRILDFADAPQSRHLFAEWRRQQGYP